MFSSILWINKILGIYLLPWYVILFLLILKTCFIANPEVYAAREKNGIYIPRDRYLQEEAEKKVRDDLFPRLSASI